MTKTPATRLEDELTPSDLEETDAGPVLNARREPAEPVRRCIATMERRPQAELIRFVLAPDLTVTPDLAARLPGRGAWITADRSSLDLAVKKGAFARAFKSQVRVPEGLTDLVEQLLARRCLDHLGLGRRGGDVVAGFDQTRELVRSERPAVLLEASDGAADGRGKVLGLARAAHETDGLALLLVGCFTSEQLGMALGRGRVIHACVKQGRFAHAWRAELAKLSGFRRLTPEDWALKDRTFPDPLAKEADPAARRPGIGEGPQT